MCVTVTLLPLVRTGFWFIRGWDFPRLQLAVISGALMIMAITVRSRFVSSRELFFWLGVLGVACIWQSGHVLPFTRLWPKEVQSTDEKHLIRLWVANLDYQNEVHDVVSKELAQSQADVLILIELSKKWSIALEKVRNQYHHHHEELLDDGLGLAIWSKLPMHSAETKFLVEERRPSIWATIGEGISRFNLVAVHPTPPGLQDLTGDARRDSRVRDAELVVIAKQVATNDSEAWVVAGDFNDVAWSHTTRLFKRLSGLKDPRIGRNFMGTFHADYPIVRFPIDHVFLSDGFAVANLDRHRISGSDHFAVSASITLMNPFVAVTPEPKASDHPEAKQILKQGKEDAQERGILSDRENRVIDD